MWLKLLGPLEGKRDGRLVEPPVKVEPVEMNALIQWTDYGVRWA